LMHQPAFPRGGLVFQVVHTWSSVTIENRVGYVRVVGGTAVVCPRGELDLATISDVQELLDRARATRVSSVVVDLCEVSFIDAGNVGALVGAWSAARQSGQRLRVDGLANQPARVFDILRLRGLLMPHSSNVGATGRTA
jgi:anti-anti-sigma factor